MQSLPPYFIIRIDKQEQSDKREKLTTHLIADPATTFMQRELQYGELISIGIDAHEYFPEASIGDTLLVHHMATGKTDHNKNAFYLLNSDEQYNYYSVTAFEYNGERNMSYGVINKNGILIPNRDFVFLEIKPDISGENFEFNVAGETVKTNIGFDINESGLAIAKEKNKLRQQWIEVMQQNKLRIEQLSRHMTPDAVVEIKRLEKENYKISKDINKKKYEPFKVLAINPSFNDEVFRSFGERIEPDEYGYFINQACHTTIEIDGFEMIIAEIKYFGCPLNWAKNAVTEYYQPQVSQRSA